MAKVPVSYLLHWVEGQGSAPAFPEFSEPGNLIDARLWGYVTSDDPATTILPYVADFDMRIEDHDLILKAKLIAKLANDPVFGDAAYAGRAVEDVIVTLVEKSVIAYSDLPAAMVAKLTERENIREQIRELEY